MSFLSKIGKGIGKVVGTALKVVSPVASFIIPGAGSVIGKAAGFVGNLLAPKKSASPSPAVAQSSQVVPTQGSGFFSKLIRNVKPVVTRTPSPSVIPSRSFSPLPSGMPTLRPAQPVFSSTLTGLQRTVFPSMPSIPAPAYSGGNLVDPNQGFGFKLPNLGNSSSDVDKTKPAVPVWSIVLSVGGILLTLIIFLFSGRRRR